MSPTPQHSSIVPLDKDGCPCYAAPFQNHHLGCIMLLELEPHLKQILYLYTYDTFLLHQFTPAGDQLLRCIPIVSLSGAMIFTTDNGNKEDEGQ